MSPNYLVQTALIDGSLANFLKTAAVLCLCVFPSLCLNTFLHCASVFRHYNSKHHSNTETVVVVIIISSSSISIIITIHHRHHHHQQHQDQHYDHHHHHPKHDPSHDRSYPPSRCSSCVETNNPCCIPSEKTCRVWEPQRTFSSGPPRASWPLQAANFTDLKIYMPSTRQMSLKLGAMRSFGQAPGQLGFQWRVKPLNLQVQSVLLSYFALLARHLQLCKMRSTLSHCRGNGALFPEEATSQMNQDFWGSAASM